MYCQKCGQQYKDGRFCRNCGSILPQNTPAQSSRPQQNNAQQKSKPQPEYRSQQQAARPNGSNAANRPASQQPLHYQTGLRRPSLLAAFICCGIAGLFILGGVMAHQTSSGRMYHGYSTSTFEGYAYNADGPTAYYALPVPEAHEVPTYQDDYEISAVSIDETYNQIAGTNDLDTSLSLMSESNIDGGYPNRIYRVSDFNGVVLTNQSWITLHALTDADTSQFMQSAALLMVAANPNMSYQDALSSVYKLKESTYAGTQDANSGKYSIQVSANGPLSFSIAVDAFTKAMPRAESAPTIELPVEMDHLPARAF